MDTLRDCIDALIFWHRLRDSRHESIAKRRIQSYLDAAGADPAARKAALGEIEAAWAVTDDSAEGPDMVGRYLANLDYRLPKRVRDA